MNLIPAFFIIDQENIGIRKKHAIKHTTYGITPYICVVKHNCKANMVKRLLIRQRLKLGNTISILQEGITQSIP
mgnify:CR=1 FL=1